MLFRHYFLSGNTPGAKKTGKRIFEMMEIDSRELNSIFIFPQIRFLSYKLLYLEISGAPLSKQCDHIHMLIDFCRTRTRSMSNEAARIVLYTVGETFSHSEQGSKFLDELNDIFRKVLHYLPDSLFSGNLSALLNHIEPNGLLMHRPFSRNWSSFILYYITWHNLT